MSQGARRFCDAMYSTVRLAHILVLAALIGSAACSTNTSPSSTTSKTTPSTFTITWNSTTFPATAVGAIASATVVATLWNTGAAAVTLGSVTNSNAAEFPWSTTCQLGGTLAAATSCTVTTQFKPSALGVQTASLVINASTQTETLSLTGTGVQAVNPQLTITPSAGSASTAFALTLAGATPNGQVMLNTTYTPAPGSMDILFAPTAWTADASGNLTVTISHDSPGTFENWFVDVTTGLSSNHVTSTVQ
jgi:hypothetical protein